MRSHSLVATAAQLLASDKGLLAIDESIATCNARFATLGIPQSEESRRAYREMLLTTPRLAGSISGAILCDETFHQSTANGTAFLDLLADSGILAGIKVDLGAVPLAGRAGETVTEGLDGLRQRLAGYAELGARFAKWRAVFRIGRETPSVMSIHANVHALARYAALCQEAGLVPIVEPEVVMDGAHSIERCGSVTEAVLRAVFRALYAQDVSLEGMILKPNMVLPGAPCPDPVSHEDVAHATIDCLLRSVPAAVPGVTFLSGGQPAELASGRLNAMNGRSKDAMPWALSFSFARAVQQPALGLWGGKAKNVDVAQHALELRVAINRAACRGAYRPSMEHDDTSSSALRAVFAPRRGPSGSSA
uniref:class I fructose-bisphosphate aldolase n=1 Tax=uncultured Sphingomonas sp. TaxID=158754 RepID=UPI0035C94689